MNVYYQKEKQSSWCFESEKEFKTWLVLVIDQISSERGKLIGKFLYKILSYFEFWSRFNGPLVMTWGETAEYKKIKKGPNPDVLNFNSCDPWENRALNT